MTLLAAILLFAASSIHDWMTNVMAARLAGADPAVCLARFRDYPPSKGKLGFPRCLFENPLPPNPDFYLKGIDFSCASPWNDACGVERAGTLISKRHIISAAHYALGEGVRILFTDNVVGVCPCYIGKSKVIAGTDIQISALTSEVTPNIRPAKILPPDFAKYIGSGYGLPVVTFNKHEEALLADLYGISTNASAWRLGCCASTNAVRKPFRKPLIKGDSGNPAFLLIGDEAILLYCLTYGDYGSGPALHRYRREIQQAMDELCPGYKLESFDFAKLFRKK